MKILGHIHTFNDADIIEQTLEALLAQTYPLPEILLVDNASTDGTLDRDFPEKVTVLRHEANLGTSGTVITGMQYALAHQYDWIWIFDADSVVPKDSLAKLVELYNTMATACRERVGFLACLPLSKPDDRPMHGALFTSRGLKVVRPKPEQPCYRCHVTIWSGCLYSMAMVRAVGFPSPDYVLDWGEFEYDYRIMKVGYLGFVHCDSILHHNIRGSSSLSPRRVHIGPFTLRGYEFPPIRCYYALRNMLYFGLYQMEEYRLALLRGIILWVVRLTGNFLLRPLHHQQHIVACFRGIWHGLRKRMQQRF